VFCLEGVDQPDDRVFNVVVDPGTQAAAEFDSTILNGIPVINGNCQGTEYIPETTELKTYKKLFYAVPYYAWAHRGRTEMAVWLATNSTKTRPVNSPEIAELSIASSSGGYNLQSLNDKLLNTKKYSESTQYFYWDHQTDSAWVQYDFQQQESVSKVQIYWVKNKDMQFPASWRILVWFAGEWKPVWNPERKWDIREDGFSEVYFETVKTKAIRLEALMPEVATSGIAEWRVY